MRLVAAVSSCGERHTRGLHRWRIVRKRNVCCMAQKVDVTSQGEQRAEEPVAHDESPSRSVTRTSETVAQKRKSARLPESTDWVASSLTRRFGIAGGLAWFGFLAIGTLGEQVKTRIEVAREHSNAQNVTADWEGLPGSVRYRPLRIGGGSTPRKGDLVVINFTLSVDAAVIEDTFQRGKPIVFLFKSRPLTGGMSAGLEEALAQMKAGGRALCEVPPDKGFGAQSYVIESTRHAGDKGVVPPNSTLLYDIELLRVSIAP